MRRLAAVLILAALSTAALAQNVGSEAPDFTLVGLDGETIRLADYRGMPVVVNVWATWCRPCEAELPYFQRAADDLSDTVALIMLNLGERPEVVSAFLEQRGLSLPVALTPSRGQAASLRAAGDAPDDSHSVARRYHVYGLPTTFLIDQRGVLAAQHVGPLDAVDLASLLATVGVAWVP